MLVTSCSSNKTKVNFSDHVIITTIINKTIVQWTWLMPGILHIFSWLYHIRIIEVAWTSNLSEFCCIFSVKIQDARHGIPRIRNVSIVAPQVTVLGDLHIIWLWNAELHLVSKLNFLPITAKICDLSGILSQWSWFCWRSRVIRALGLLNQLQTPIKELFMTRQII